MATIPKAIFEKIKKDIRRALKEDCPSGDITSSSCISPKAVSSAFVIAKGDMVISGLQVFREVMLAVDAKTMVALLAKDGDRVKKGGKVLRLKGRSVSLLKGERVALNYLQRMCGVATLTALFVKEVRGTKAKIFDTRKTTPLLRDIEKYAVTCGGGFNHRISLSDMPLIKENHITAAGGIANAVKQVKRKTDKAVMLEARNRLEVLAGLKAGAELLLLDNMVPAEVRKMVALIKGRAVVELSGGVSLKSVKRYASTGVDRISIGALTHSAPASDLSLLFSLEK